MEKINFETRIDAPKEKVWETLWNDASYRKWTSPFCEGSYAITDNWTEGTEVKFLSPDGGGMVSRVASNRQPDYMSFEHLGELKKGEEDRTSDSVKEWAGAKENYTLTEENGATILAVDLQILESHKDYFLKAWPKALEAVKELAES